MVAVGTEGGSILTHPATLRQEVAFQGAPRAPTNPEFHTTQLLDFILFQKHFKTFYYFYLFREEF